MIKLYEVKKKLKKKPFIWPTVSFFGMMDGYLVSVDLQLVKKHVQNITFKNIQAQNCRQLL